MKQSKQAVKPQTCRCSVALLGPSPSTGAEEQRRGVAGRPSDNDQRNEGKPRDHRDRPELPDVHHIGLVVADRDRALATLQQGLGFGRAHLLDMQASTARVSTGVIGFGLRVGFVWLGNTLLELLQPVDDRSPHATFLKERGEGMHHLGFLVPSIERELDAMASTRDGERPSLLVDARAADGVSWCYVEGEYASGAVIELIERSQAAERFFEGIYDVTGGRLPAFDASN